MNISDESTTGRDIGPVYIYALLDPVTRDVAYVGQTRRPLEDRLYSHMHSWISIPLNAWLKAVKAAGLQPDITPLLLTDSANANAAEWRLVRRMREMGYNLLNDSRPHPYTYPSSKRKGRP